MILLIVLAVHIPMVVITGRWWLRWYMETSYSYLCRCDYGRHSSTCMPIKRSVHSGRTPVDSWYAFLTGMVWPITLACLMIARAPATNGELEQNLRHQEREIARLTKQL